MTNASTSQRTPTTALHPHTPPLSGPAPTPTRGERDLTAARHLVATRAFFAEDFGDAVLWRGRSKRRDRRRAAARPPEGRAT